MLEMIAHPKLTDHERRIACCSRAEKSPWDAGSETVNGMGPGRFGQWELIAATLKCHPSAGKPIGKRKQDRVPASCGDRIFDPVGHRKENVSP